MNINPYILIAAFMLSFVVFYIAKRYQWEKKIAYHASIAIMGCIGLAFFTYILVQHFNTAYLIVNIFLLIGIILKVVKILQLSKKKE